MASSQLHRTRPSGMERWARYSYRNRWQIIGAWLFALVALTLLSSRFGGEFSTEFSIPGAETQTAVELLQQVFPDQSGEAADVVFVADNGLTEPGVREKLRGLFNEYAQLDGVLAVQSPYGVFTKNGWVQTPLPPGATSDLAPGFASPDGRYGRASVQFAEEATKTEKAVVDRLVELTKEAGGDGLQIVAGGSVVQFHEGIEFGSEVIGLIAAIVILLIAFGSVIAMGLPIGAALFGLGSGFALLGLATNIWDFPEFSPQFGAMIGIGVGIDYSLLVVTRYREGLHSGKSVEDSIVLAVTTSGRAVIFAGVVVAIALLGLFAMGLPFMAALGSAGAVVVLVAVLVATTLMPAALAVAGTKVDSLKVPFLHNTEGVDLSSGWYRLSTRIQRNPLPYAVLSAGLLIVLSLPVLDMRLGFSDAGNGREELGSRQTYDLLAEGFGAGFNGPLVVVAQLTPDDPDLLERTSSLIGKTEGVAAVAPPIVNEAGDTAVITVFPTSSPQDKETVDLVHRLRQETLPAAQPGEARTSFVTGSAAGITDVGDRITERMPYLFIGVIGLSFLLLIAVFRSVVVAVKAAIMNLLSIGASYGVIVAVFQWGWFSNLLGVGTGPIESFLPVMLFAILFGLSMDYEVFLISRIREEYLSGKSNSTAVSHGLTATARVISAAAAIMVTVFLAFVLGDDRIIKQFGLGLATAIFVDATIVRLILVPSTMELLGERNWWLPGWLDRIIPKINVEGEAEAAPVIAPSPAGGGS